MYPTGIEPQAAKAVRRYFPELRKWRSTRKLERSALHREISPYLSRVLDRCEMGDYLSLRAQQSNPEDQRDCFVAGAPRNDIFRAVSWNAERGLVFDGLVDVLSKHPEMSRGDVYFFPETDWGMARSQNRDVARELAQKLKMSFAFAPCYINLDKGNGVENHVDGENELGIHGNAILSRWPIQNPRAIRLKNCKDKMRGKEKRLGSQQAVLADVMLPSGPLRAVCVHLDAHSSQKQRRDQMKTILNALARENFSGATLIGGDWNTSCYCASHSFFAFFSFWRKVAMGPKHVCENHYKFPERWFERQLFNLLDRRGFDYRNFNAMGEPTIHYRLGDERMNKNMHDWTPKLFQRFVDWAMKKAEGLASFKLDWFAAQHLKAVADSQKVLRNLAWKGQPVSDHDAIMVDFVP